MRYDVIDLSKYIITKCYKEKKPISNLQLQKILYFIQREFLKNGHGSAFDSCIEAWQFGPVVPDAYFRFYGYGSTPITYEYEYGEINSVDKVIIDQVIKKRREQDPWKMVQETHRDNGAWDQVYDGGKGNRKVIPIIKIKSDG